MAKIDRIAAHPLRAEPYHRLKFVKLNHHRVPLYRVAGCEKPPAGAFETLGRAFAKYGGKCFYCPTKFKPQPLSANDQHRDHVIATSSGGSDFLHNLVIACGKCGRTKADDPIHDFRPRAAKEYMAALEQHIAACIRESDPESA